MILLHGFPKHGLAWQKQIQHLATQGYWVWAPDQRGYAGSDKPKDIASYNMNALAADIIGLIDAAAVKQANVIGHDWGAAVTWWLSSNHPERIKKMAILNVPHPKAYLNYIKTHPRQIVKSWYVFVFQLPLLPEYLLRNNNCQRLLDVMQSTSVHGTFSHVDFQQYIQQWSQAGALTGMLNWYRAALRTPLKPRLGTIPVPTRILWGRKDHFLQKQLAELSSQYCEQLDGLYYLDDAGHWLAHEKSAQVNKILSDFLAG